MRKNYAEKKLHILRKFAENNYTALRDIHDLIDKKILKRTEEGGRSTNYVLDNTNIR